MSRRGHVLNPPPRGYIAKLRCTAATVPVQATLAEAPHPRPCVSEAGPPDGTLALSEILQQTFFLRAPKGPSFRHHFCFVALLWVAIFLLTLQQQMHSTPTQIAVLRRRPVNKPPGKRMLRRVEKGEAAHYANVQQPD